MYGHRVSVVGPKLYDALHAQHEKSDYEEYPDGVVFGDAHKAYGVIEGNELYDDCQIEQYADHRL